jgi:hypothetical protein
MFKYLLFLENNSSNKYIIECENKELVRQNIKTVLNINNENFSCECFDSTFDEFYTIIGNNFPDKGKLKITLDNSSESSISPPE